MDILAMDIGAGTKDILLYQSGRSPENWAKLVLPSPSEVYAERVKKATLAGQHLFLSGATIGGGSLAQALKRHLKAGLRLLMTEKTAFTIRNDLREVTGLGVEIVSSTPPDFQGQCLEIDELNLGELARFLTQADIELSRLDVLAVAVQDHGVPRDGGTNREARLQAMSQALSRDPHPWNLAFAKDEIPQGHWRMLSAAEVCHREVPQAKVMVMDTAPAAIYGCLEDPMVEEAAALGEVILVNLGNHHTMAAIISGEMVKGLFEHHTALIGPQKLEAFLERFARGELSSQEVFEDGGHGAFYLSQPQIDRLENIFVTGPNRRRAKETGFQVRYAFPAGDAMMTGPMGLIRAAKKNLGD